MICCAICGLTKLNHQCKRFKKINNMYNNLNTNEFGCTLYGIANCLLYMIIHLLEMERRDTYV
jgi:hypothetical protein